MSQLLLQAQNGILQITINRESKLNALNTALIAEFEEVLQQYRDDSSIFGLIITGSGSKAFAAGADIAEFAQYNSDEGRQMAAKGMPMFRAIETYPKPIIAAVNGFALGGGCELAMACHLRVAATNARFGQPEVNLGLIPGYGGTQRLPQLIGRAKALELIMTAEPIKADEALQLGLVNYVVEPDQLLPKCYELLQKIATKAPRAIARVISAVNAYYDEGVNGFTTEMYLFGECFDDQDFKEGTTAFIEKRKANFSGK
ncbi:MAG: enoyl-CoA hydratase/isomerase family protein [Sphingobacteriales bacterium]|nr:enoyl-CoA hydratase/isomerase family protein [Sphingobacteriales bacterium]